MLRCFYFFRIGLLGLVLTFSSVKAKDVNNLLMQLSKTQGKEKYNVCQQLVALFEFTDDATALKYALMMEETASDMGNAQWLAQARLTAARLFLRTGNINQALDYSVKSLEWLASHGTPADIANAYLISGVCMHSMTNYSVAAEHYARALNHFEMAYDADGQAKTYIRIALLFEELSDYELMNKFALLALRIAQNSEIRNQAYSKYAQSLARSDSADKAMSVLQRLSDSLGNIRDLKNAFAVNYIMQVVLLDFNKIEEAKRFIEKDIIPAQESAANYYLGLLYTRLAHIYDLKGDLDKTLEYNKKALYYRELSGEPYPIASSLNNLAGDLIRLGRYREAYKYLKRAHRIAIESGNISTLTIIYDRLAEYYFKTGKRDSLFLTYQKRSYILDSLRNVHARNQARVLYSHLEAERNLPTLYPKAVFRNPWFWTIVLLLIFLWTGVLLWLIRKHGRMKKRFREALRESRQLNINLEKRIGDLKENQETSELKVKALAENIPLGVGLVDVEENFVFVNPALCDMLGFASKDLIGKNLKELMPPEEFKRIPYLTLNRKEGKSETYTVTLLKKDKTPIEVQVSACPYFNSQGDFLGSLGIIQDLTERNQMIASLKEARDKAMESERLKSNFLAVMSHEIRTPLNAILNGVELIFSNQLLEEEREMMVQEIHQSARTLLDMWDNLILLSKLRSGIYVVNKKWILPAQIVQDKLEEFYGFIPKEKSEKIEWISSVAPSEDIEAYTDAEIISRTVHCLLSNAIKFTQEGRISVSLFLEDNSINLTVEDSGKGISEMELKYIFSYFRQGEEGMTRTFGGAGIGLSIVKDLLDRVSGTIEVLSEPGKGTRVFVKIPAPTRKAGEKWQNHGSSLLKGETDWSGKTILVAEDVDSNFLLLETVIKKYGANVLRAENGEEVMLLLKENPQVDLILMDIHMPGLNGLEATKLIRQINNEIVIIAQTAYAMIHDRDEILSSGCTDFIAKPIRIPALVEMLNFYLSSKK
ncbi:MAG: hypothetical protein PWR20_2079 [Bacteroidales bacterium]|jgi:PAS domain S-box-containing protein|nr:hypothetical protein [Bacteroidales bacterium]MDN5329465.1 hypothetical protein [Bacteroidales bacterium]